MEASVDQHFSGTSNVILSTGSGLRWFTRIFHLYTSLNSEDIQCLKDWILETWANLAMVNYPYLGNFLKSAFLAYQGNRTISCPHLQTTFWLLSEEDILMIQGLCGASNSRLTSSDYVTLNVFNILSQPQLPLLGIEDEKHQLLHKTNGCC